MQTRRVGRSGLEVSEIALGGWLTLGSRTDAAGDGSLARRAFDLGVNLFDTADVYADGAAETALGAALRDVPRHQIVLATKCFFATSEHPNASGLSRKHVVESVEGSLRRLGTEYLDLHQCHRFDPDVPVEETVRAYEDLVRQGKLLYWGVSTWGRDEIQAACDVADRVGAYRPISNQTEYSLVHRRVERDVLPWCDEHGVGVLAFSALAQGVLTGKYRDGARPQRSRAADAERNAWMKPYLHTDVLARVERLRPIARESSLSMTQLALAWCLRRPSVASVIVGATSPEQLEECCSASGATLSDAAKAAIDEIFAADSDAESPWP